MPDYQPVFPRWPRQPLPQPAPSFGEHAVDLLAKMLVYDPEHRIRVSRV